MKFPLDPQKAASVAAGDAGGAGGVPDGTPDCIDPRTVIRGESSGVLERQSDAGIPLRVLTDWLNVTFPFAPSEPAIHHFVRRFTEVTRGAFGGMGERGRGLYGWLRSFAFDFGQVLFAVGGQGDTAFLSFPGEGCALVHSWSSLVELLRDEFRGRITRWDGAVDDFVGVHSVDSAVKLYLSGGFNSGGRPPQCRQAGNWLTPDDKGRTFYVGDRANGKVLRVYEKGKQLGRGDYRWVRWEVEVHNNDRVIDWEVVVKPDRFIAGAYQCMSWVGSERSRIATVRRQDALSYKRLAKVASVAYGRLINVMVEREGSADRVVALLRRSGAPQRLEFSDRFLRKHGKEPDV